jgi:hypothetical protein
MREFFRGWKRKVGVVTLLMALAFMGGWVRSFWICDLIVAPNGGHSYHEIFSSGNWIGWVMVPCTKGTVPKTYRSFYGWHKSNVDRRVTEEGPFSSVSVHMEVKGAGYNFKYSELANAHLIFPYPSIVVPLTLLSAFLLLSKPKPKAEPTAP